MIEISPLAESDRAEWEALSRDYKAHFGVASTDEEYEQAFRRFIDTDELYGITARVNGTMVGLAHYWFHVSVWETGYCRCYLQDLFVDPGARRQGVARALIEWLAADAEARGATRLHWDTTVDNTARALYDQVGRHRGFIAYARRLGAADQNLAGSV
ncbi:MAG TPA: GNAT family N-acetyltransferase [Actinospica sp.]|nr:GNAT family N-acetyltransferase [Actinospica sp.]